ncbi:hypothetical protein INR49_032906 [Caranx melampygus]|nr:hypothetical protein INR49_032906 [Caranx melampygus]
MRMTCSLFQTEAKLVTMRSELSALFERRMEEKDVRINHLTKELNGMRHKMKEREEHVTHLNQDVVGLRATQDSLKRTLVVKEKHTQQLLQTSEYMLNGITETLDQTNSSLNTERRQKQQIQDQLHHDNKEVERLQQELTNMYRTTQKKMQRREMKICVLLKELAGSKKQHSDCQTELFRKEKHLEKLHQQRDELRAKMEDQSKECVHLTQTKERLGADLALSHEKLHISHLEVRSRDKLILQLRNEMKTAEEKYQVAQEQVAALEGEVKHLNLKVMGHQEEACQLSKKFRDIECLKDQKEIEEQQLRDQLHVSQQQTVTFEEKLKKQENEMGILRQRLKGAMEELKGASLETQEQKESVTIFKQKYSAAIEKVHRVQGRVEVLEEELQYSQQQLRESQLATHSVKTEHAELERRYQEKVGQWESSQEALDQLTDELQANQNLLRKSQQKLDHFKSLTGSLHVHVDSFKQQCCAEQVERIAECEKGILQMKSDLERQAQEKADLKQSLTASHHTHVSSRSQLEQEVTRLKSKVTHLELKLADTQKVRVALLRQSEEELKEARQEAARKSREVDVQRGEVQRLQEELQREEEKMRGAIREKKSLSTYIKQLSRELEELRSKHQVAVEDLAAHAEEARRMEGCLNEGKLAEEKIRSMAMRLETEVVELRRNLQQAVNQELKAESEKEDAQDQVETLRTELEGTWSDNAKLRHESQLIMTNVDRWIAEQKDSNKSLAAQMKAQNKVLLIVNDEKEHLQEANDTLKVEVKRLKEVAEKKERDMERFKAQIRDRGVWQDERTMENQSCVALNLSKIEEMQTRLRSNLEAIRMLNQQLNTLSRENKQLRRQLEQERSMRRQVEQQFPPPPTSQHCSSIHLPIPFQARPPTPAIILPSSLHLPIPVAEDTDRTLTQAKISVAGLEKPGESQALSKALWLRPAAERSVSASLEDARSGRTSRDLTK